MTSDSARASDGGATATRSRSRLIPGPRDYKVVAKDGITVDPHGVVEKGKTVKLEWDGARALLLEGSIEEA